MELGKELIECFVVFVVSCGIAGVIVDSMLGEEGKYEP